jgi:uncharacterized protein YoxC
MENQIIAEAFEDSNAKRTVLHLVICILVGLAFDAMFLSPFTGFWCIMSGIMYIGYITVLITKYRAEEAENVKISLQLEEEEIDAKKKEINLLAVAIKEKANALNEKASAMQKLESDVRTLSDERRMLTSQAQTLSNDLAIAKQSLADAKQAHANAIESLKQSHEKALSSLELENKSLAKQLEGFQSMVRQIKLKERQEYVRKAFIASKSANKGDLDKVKASMEERARIENEPLFLDFEKYLK